MTIDFAKLYEPFPPEAISWRVGSTNSDKTKGMALAYIDARDVMNRLDAVCGAENWQTDYPWGDGKRVVCRIGIRISGEWIWKGDGAGDTDVEGDKGALSDAFKRAAVKWGVGRYLYDLDSPWVALEPMGRSYKIKESEHARLRALLAGKAPAPAPKADPDKEEARKMYAIIVAAIAAATHPGDPALGLKVDRKDREDIAFIRKHGGDAAADKLHTLAANKIAELARKDAA